MVFSSSSHHVSLFDALTSFLETLPVQQRPDIKSCSPWEGMVSVCKNPQLRKDFVHTLSLSQGNSLRLLLLWKSGSLSFPTLVNIRFLPPEELRSDESFRALFRMEQRTYDYSEYSQDSPMMLFIARKVAAETCSYRRLLKSYLSASLKIKEPPNDAASSDYVFLEQAVKDDMGGRALSSSIGSSTRVKGQGLPLYLWDTWDRRTVETKRLSQNSLRYAAISHTWGRWRLDSPGVDMRPMVPWPVPQNSLYSVRDLPDGLKSLAAKLSLRYMWIDLFCIPQNGSEEASREISRQAEIFGGARTAVAWLNTMPSWEVLGQTVSWLLVKPLVPDNLRIDLPIIVRARFAFFNFVHSRGKQSLGIWRHFFGTNERIRRRFCRLDKRLRSRDIPSFYYHTEAIEDGHEDKTNAASLGFLTFHWFSSLWTLQESTLRPDMLLANKGWELFEITSEAPVALDTITQLSYMWTSEFGPTPVKWLGAMIARSGICLNSFEDPLQALAIGTTRSCTSRRSEAIMSLLGCVEWHRNVIADRQSSTLLPSEPNRHLLLGLYEYEFIHEVLQKYRSSFFSSQYSNYSFFFEVLERREPLGTILPFPTLSKYRPPWTTVRFMPGYAFQCCVTHPSVNTWELLRDGSVKMSKVGILYRTPDVNRRGAWGSLFRDHYTILAPNDQLPLERMSEARLLRQRMPLGKWMDTCWTNLSKYAVVVSWANNPVHLIAGFILAEVEINGSSSAKHLAKLADFECAASNCNNFTVSELPRMTEVDWIVY